MFLCILLVRGTKESIFINRILVFVKIAVIFIFLCLAIPNIDVRNWDPFLPFGYQGIASGAAIVFFAYIGFDAVATSAEEAKNPSLPFLCILLDISLDRKILLEMCLSVS